MESLESLPLKSRINLIAYVTGVTEVKKSGGGGPDTLYLASQVKDADVHIDWAKTYHLSDPSRPESMKGFTVNLFSKAADWLPDAEVGQILILRSLLVRPSLLFCNNYSLSVARRIFWPQKGDGICRWFKSICLGRVRSYSNRGPTNLLHESESTTRSALLSRSERFARSRVLQGTRRVAHGVPFKCYSGQT